VPNNVNLRNFESAAEWAECQGSWVELASVAKPMGNVARCEHPCERWLGTHSKRTFHLFAVECNGKGIAPGKWMRNIRPLVYS